ncbi:MAG: hypothetical protein IJI14_08080 [Anaerolineaceae bacterium]|nr:hypothetical protein [Anaerolineaceae bacterium]
MSAYVVEYETGTGFRSQVLISAFTKQHALETFENLEYQNVVATKVRAVYLEG